MIGFEQLRAEVSATRAVCHVGRVARIHRGTVEVVGLSAVAGQSDLVKIGSTKEKGRLGEVIGLSAQSVTVLPDGDVEGLTIGEAVSLLGNGEIAPDDSWIGRVIDPFGKALDGRPILRGINARPLRGVPVNPTQRRVLGARLERAWRFSTRCCRSYAGSGSAFLPGLVSASRPCWPSWRAVCRQMWW